MKQQQAEMESETTKPKLMQLGQISGNDDAAYVSDFQPTTTRFKPEGAAARTFDKIVAEHNATNPGHSDPDNRDDGFMERTRFLLTALAGEAGEALNKIKKEWRGDEEIREDYDFWEAALIEEIVDAANYLSMIAHHLDLPLNDMQMQKFLDFEKRPQWAQLVARMRAPALYRNLLTLNLFSGDTCTLPLAPLGSVTSRLNSFMRNRSLPISITTSKETIEQLKHIGGVIREHNGKQFFEGLPISAWE